MNINVGYGNHDEMYDRIVALGQQIERLRLAVSHRDEALAIEHVRAIEVEAHAAELEGLLAQARKALEVVYADWPLTIVQEALTALGSVVIQQEPKEALASLPTPQVGTEQHGSTP